MKLNEKITYYRKRNGLSQENLAEQIGVSRQAVSKWETGDALPETNKILLLASAFGITADELLSESDPVSFPIHESNQNSDEAPQTDAPPRSRRDSFSGIFGFIKRKGYIAGYIYSFYGLLVMGIGLIARMGFKALLSPTDMFSDFSSFPGFESSFESSVSGFSHIPIAFATGIIIFGAIMCIGGIILAIVLKKKGNK